MFRGMTLFKCTECGKHFMAAELSHGFLLTPQMVNRAIEIDRWKNSYIYRQIISS